MRNRRNFIKQVSAAAVVSSMPLVHFSQQKPAREMIWANLLHLSSNMWGDFTPEEYRNDSFPTTCEKRGWGYWYRPSFSTDEAVWDSIIQEMANAGMNMVLIDLGDSIVYESHPEIAVNNAWTPAKLKKKLEEIRNLGMEPIPKLNFSSNHDAWLGVYSRMVSTDTYYAVCKNLIEEVITLFDKPRFFHLGMDEESLVIDRRDYIVIRQNDLWWNDLYFLIDVVEKNSSRPWVWSDYGWKKPELFFRKMPKSVLQSSWYYNNDFSGAGDTRSKFYEDLEAHGYDQVPCGSNWVNPDNFGQTVDYCKEVINPSKLYGFLMAPWRMTVAPCFDIHKEAIKQVSRAMKKDGFQQPFSI